MNEERNIDAVRALIPSTLWWSAQAGALTGAAGLALGGVVGISRSTTPGLFALASGIQCSTLGATYWFARQWCVFAYARTKHIPLEDVSPQQRRNASGIAGGISGATTAALFRTRSHILPGTIMFSLFGLLGQTIYNRVDAQESAPIDQERASSLWHRLVHSRFNPMKVLSDEDYEHMLSEKLLRVEAEIALLDEEMSKLKQSSEST